ncbi:hypothetical protein J4E93_001025 [Alternaria ventricosa]|uniref:uncharacterized protein n=1 Tax=Alternaria ventricosa TaxID=1187951 RepID=UPI0020C563BD|nr:uncharacterized protein J4E93_001025 [Alternaria ventricosa]KAI4656306.1 hypothetical protein J4E93_001025 [Alternaria ventricosa]
MVDKIGRPRKAVGSNDPSETGKGTTRGRPQHQASSHSEAYYSAHDGFEDAPMQSAGLSAPQLRDFEEAQAEPEPRARPANIRTGTVAESQIGADEEETPYQPASAFSSSSSSWEDLPSSATASLPTATPFPGTWPAAIHDTSAALSEVSTATLSFASAIASSGLGRASWSIGAATLSSTNRAALTFTAWGMEKTGVMPNELPAPMRKWIQGKEDRDRRRRHAEQRRRDRRRRERDGVVITGGVDEEGGYVLATHEMDGTLNFEGRGPLDIREEAGEQEKVQDHETGREEIEEEQEDEGGGLVGVFEFDDDEDI